VNKLVTSAQILCWIAIAGFAAASVTVGLYLPRITQDLWCANMITDLLSALLSYFAPAAGCAVIALSIFWYRGALRVWNPVLGGGVLALSVGAALTYGGTLFRTILPSHSLSDGVWWLRLMRAVH
jgi:hypothetical protein